MTLVDTSIWVDHLNKVDSTLQKMLEAGEVLSHAFVIGELAMGNSRPRDAILEKLNLLPVSLHASHKEVLRFISAHGLHGLGVGYIDVHLLASVQLTPDARLWTRDKRLAAVAQSMDLAFQS